MITSYCLYTREWYIRICVFGTHACSALWTCAGGRFILLFLIIYWHLLFFLHLQWHIYEHELFMHRAQPWISICFTFARWLSLCLHRIPLFLMDFMRNRPRLVVLMSPKGMFHDNQMSTRGSKLEHDFTSIFLPSVLLCCKMLHHVAHSRCASDLLVHILNLDTQPVQLRAQS